LQSLLHVTCRAPLVAAYRHRELDFLNSSRSHRPRLQSRHPRSFSCS
jgi:hypothetical protein